ncbi:2-oxoacid dehydrogenases acyltransferase-domain-containing protein [Lactarius quietus]|nr:2-oxoacid dehydrogenases acyltransferase-domain-containing protein [Lactarius quietus]
MSLIRTTRCVLRSRNNVAYFHPSPAWWAARKVLQRFKLADIGEGITECEVIKWNISPQSSVSAFDALCEVQSDKASVEITSPFEGTVKEILVQEGEVAKVGDGLCVIETEEDSSEHSDNSTAVAPAAKRCTRIRRATPLTCERLKRPPCSPPPAPAADVLALPAVRHLARQKGVDIALLTPGTGKKGRVERVDVEWYLARGKSAGEQPSSTIPCPAEQDVVVELGRTRYGMWKAMEKSLAIPHFGYSTSLDITALHNILPILNANIPQHYLPPSKVQSTPPLVSASSFLPTPPVHTPPASGTYDKLTYLPVLLKTLSKAMHAWPLFRSSITPGSASEGRKPTLTVRPNSDICVALSTPTGLYTPTVRAADKHSVYSVASTLKHLAHLGRQVPSALTPAELPRRGGTLTVSNIGAVGAGESAMPLLVPGGGVAIVALGRARWVWDVERGDGTGERRLKMAVSWSADHRVVEGAELAAFVETWRGYVEQPERMIGEGV